MTAITRSASITPSSMSSSRPDASETCLIGTLRTSMGSGTTAPPINPRASGGYCAPGLLCPRVTVPQGYCASGVTAPHGYCASRLLDCCGNGGAGPTGDGIGDGVE